MYFCGYLNHLFDRFGIFVAFIAIFSFSELVLVVIVALGINPFNLMCLYFCEIYIVKFKSTNILGGMCNLAKLVILY